MYIHSLSCISALPLINVKDDLQSYALEHSSLEVQEPKYSDYIAPMQLRRMSKGLKMGLTTAIDCLKQSSILPSQINAIEVGTAYGLLKDSETFLNNLIEQQETALNPTPFIQSTHNTVSGAIALNLQIRAHNMTFVQNAHSFESALRDAALVLNETKDAQVLIGAVDEKIETLDWLVNQSKAQVAIGEGAAFFLINNQAEKAICQLKSYQIFKTKNADVANEKLKQVMANYDCIHGKCPTIIWNSLNPQILSFSYKIINVSAIIGYNPTGAALALAMGIKQCQQKQSPVVIINQFKEYWSVFELA